MGRRGTDVAKEAASIVAAGRSLRDARRRGREGPRHLRQHPQVRLRPVQLQPRRDPGGPQRRRCRDAAAAAAAAHSLAEPRDRHLSGVGAGGRARGHGGMERPPRDPHGAILSKTFVQRVAIHATVITGSTLAADAWPLDHAAAASTTMAFMTLALAQTFHLGNARSAQHVLSSRAALANRFAIGAVAISIGLLPWRSTCHPWRRRFASLR